MLWDMTSEAELLSISISVPVGDFFPWDTGGGNGELWS